MKNTHILHFEDLLYRKGCKYTVQLIDNLKHIKSYSIKVDGKPSILFGNHQNEFFISTKSGFSKSPTLYKSIEQIEQIPDKDLANKLSILFDSLKNNYTKVYQADVLWYNTPQTALISQNSLVYNFTHVSVLSKHKHALKRFVGLSTHTAYDSLETFNRVEVDLESSHLFTNYDNMVLFEYDLEYAIGNILNNATYDYVKANAELLDKMLIKLNSSYCSIDKMMNSFVRNKIDITQMTEYSLQGLCYEYFNQTLKQHKNKLKSDNYKNKFDDIINKKLDIINTPLFVQFCKTYILLTNVRNTVFGLFHTNLINIPVDSLHIGVSKPLMNGRKAYHEGFVIEVDNMYIKFVDRINYSYNNFILNG